MEQQCFSQGAEGSALNRRTGDGENRRKKPYDLRFSISPIPRFLVSDDPDSRESRNIWQGFYLT
jgi:hypothetical protein